MKRVLLILACNLLLSGAVAFAADDDGDGIDSAVETTIGTDPNDPDTDNDGLLDGQEDLDQDGIVDANETNAKDADTDDDGISDGQEPVFSLNNRIADTDADGLSDGLEIGRASGIAGGTSDFAMIPYSGTNLGVWTPDSDPVSKTDPLDADSDDDGINDGNEDKNHNGLTNSTEPNPADADTDDDGLRDGEEDLDDDCVVDAGETNPLDSDSDDDLLNDGLEKGKTSPVPAGASSGIYVSNRITYQGTAGGWAPDSDPGTTTDPADNDTDNDGLTDGVEDNDHDGFKDATETDPNDADTDDDTSNDFVDCSPLDPSIYPGATEVPGNSIDEDCNGFIDCYLDNDNDNYGCFTVVPNSYAAVGGVGITSCGSSGGDGKDDSYDDCIDNNPTINPGASEIPGDGVDQNCDGMELCYKDADDDGYRPDASSTVSSIDCDCSDAYEATAADPTTDCEDGDPNVHPGAEEIPGNGIDENCDGSDACTCYSDNDLDGYGDPASPFISLDGDCTDPNEAATGTDCNDAVGSIYPGATEIPDDGIDQDCNGVDAITCYLDDDMDTYGTSAGTVVIALDGVCNTAQKESTTSNDCDDSDPAINPGATEIPADGIDQNCDGIELCFKDADDDGFRPDASSTVNSADCDCSDQFEAVASDPTTDCNDANASIHPGAVEICNGADDDCNTFFDDNAVDASLWYLDFDSDGYGNPTISTFSCSQPAGYVATATDCNDNNDLVYPGAEEIPGDGIDENCDGIELCFTDYDDDGYRPDMFSTVNSTDCDCTDLHEATSTDPDGDCNDSNPYYHPGAGEYCDDPDYNCDGITYNNSSGSLTETACDSYTAPDGQVFTSSGIVTAVIPNSAGCDSTITIDLTVSYSNSGSITASVCGSYTAPDGTVYTSSGIVTAVIPNTAGCDSTITIDLTVNYSNSGSITVSACDSYTAPDGTIYTSSGIVTAVIPNATGCDSTITIDLTVNNNTTSSISETVCNSYTAPDSAVYTSSGIVTAVILNATGCDSTITIDLTVKNNTTNSISETGCESYTAPDGTVYTSSGIVTAVIPNTAGCDSTITIDLTVNNSSSSSITETACNIYTAPDGTVYTSSGIITAVIPNAAGCDSTITIDLTINNSTSNSITETACDIYTAPDGLIYTSSGIITAIIPNAAGCDSTITIDLTINNSTSNSITETACNSYTAPDGVVYTTSGIITAVIPNAAGCDSLITIDLTIISINVSVIQSSNVLTAITSPATYQWLDCDNNYNPLTSQNNQSFVATASGNYAVEITQNSCADTSICYTVTIVNLTEENTGNEIFAYPNPTTGMVYVDMGTSLPETRLTIKDVVGKVVNEYVYNEKQLLEVKIDEPVGVYFITITSESKEAVVRIIKE